MTVLARLVAPTGRLQLVSALYRPGAPHWENAARYGQHSLDFLARRLPPIPWDVAIAEGPIGGMEYPGMTFIGRPADAADLYGVIAHEAGAHQWFPMLVGQNEAAYAWMDEGLTTFHEELAIDDFFATIERVSGRDLDWFFYPWWHETGVLDHAIERVEPGPGGTRVTVRDLGQNPMPARVVGTTTDGRSVAAEIPVESWLGGAHTATVGLPPAPLTMVRIDPEELFPDVDRTNDVWTAP